jgi:hypothetical protein
MLKNPRETAAPRAPVKKVSSARPEATLPERVSTSPYPKAKVLMGEVAAPRGLEIGKHRDAFRAFMTARHLRPTEWARAADVAPGEILGFLTAKTRHIAPQTLEKLARAAHCAIEDLFK